MVDKQRAVITTYGSHVDGLEETVDLTVFLDLLGKSKSALQKRSFESGLQFCFNKLFF